MGTPEIKCRGLGVRKYPNPLYLSDIYELKIQSPLPLPLLGRWLANKLTVLLLLCGNCLTVNTKHLYDFMQCWTCVEP